jgi:heterodisulfide reductase subunit A
MEGKKISLDIDGAEVKARKGMTILEAARGAGISIPTLCHHTGLAPFGACRICGVEIVQRGRSRIVASCVYPVDEGLVVKTKSDKVIRDRKMLIELMLAHAPKAEVIQNLAHDYGVERTRFRIEDEENLCILCGLCVRICEERMGRSAINFVGRGIDRKVDTPFHIQTEDCMVCGACASVCPTGAIKLEDISRNKPLLIPSEFDQGLISRSPIFVPYPQGVPNVPVIDRDKCVHFLTGECGICQEVCPAGAIDYEQEDEIVEIDVGSVILSPGFDEFDPSALVNYGYRKYPNVVTSIEFERMLSASGPFQGELVRCSDRQPPRRIAWIQCVGSRDKSLGRAYCSSVCCTYAIKEAIIAGEHVPFELERTIFFMDIRTQGKDFDRFYERGKEAGIDFVRAKVYGVEERDGTGNLLLKYVAEDDKPSIREFDLVVLSVGLQPSPECIALAKRLNIQLNRYGFCHTSEFSPVETSRPGIYVCGAFSGPKDIPETVMQASAAAGAASALLAPARHTLIKKKEYVPEKDVSGEEPRIGVFICRCGINIGGYVAVPQVVEYAKTLPNVVFAGENLYTCSQDTQEKIKEMIEEHNLNRVIVASCTPRTHEPLFQETMREAGLNKYLFEMANIRDQCSWVHMHEPERATEKAKDLVKMAVAKARLKEALKPLSIPVNHSALVIGGGVAGMTSALNLADQGFEVHLVERSPELGGTAKTIHHTIHKGDVRTLVSNLVDRVSKNPRIRVYTNTWIVDAYGYVGNFTTEIMRYRGRVIEKIDHGVTIIATGAHEYEPEEYLYGRDPRVLTQLELEDEIAKRNPDVVDCDNLVMIQCVGSRNSDRPYCSRVCCNQAIKNALKLKETKPDMNIYVLYRDMRTYGFYEEYYEKARQMGVIFLLYEPEGKPEVSQTRRNGRYLLTVKGKDPVLGEEVAIDADILALAVPIVPPQEARELAMLYKVPLNADGFFLEAHVKLRPVDFATEGVFICGLAHAPKAIDESIAQAKAAASRASTLLAKETITAEGIVAFVDENICSGCGICQALCPYGAIAVDEEEKVAKVNEALCKGCGTCCGACPSGAAQQRGFTAEQILSMVTAGLGV